MTQVADRKLVGVSPADALESRAALFSALQAGHPVTFEARPVGQWSGIDALIVFRREGDDGGEVRLPACPCLLVSSGPGERSGGRVRLADSPLLDPVLRGRHLDDDHAAGHAIDVDPGEAVLAVLDRTALWTVSEGDNRTYRVSLSPPELEEGEVLRDLLRSGRWLALLPFVHFLREVSDDLAWAAPGLRAAIMFDDPNLHWPSYGRLNFPDLALHASRHGYHVSVAMVPLDGRFVHPSVGRIFRERRDVFSLVMHGNDHIRLELYRDMSSSDRRAAVAQALRRTDAFERRHNIHVDRIMSSPHGLGAEDAMSAMFSLGVEAFTADWPFPWAPPDLLPPGWPLAGWEASQLLTGGLPVLPRYLFTKPLDDLVFRAFLRQPLIVYGHHHAGLDLLSAVARTINGLGDVHWTSLEAIARSNYEVRKDGSVFRVRPFSRRFVIAPPDDVDEVVVELPRSYGGTGAPGLELGFSNGNGSAPESFGFAVDSEGRVAASVPVSAGTPFEIMVQPAVPLDPYLVPSPPWKPWPVLRRVLTEGRDRLLPFMKQEI